MKKILALSALMVTALSLSAQETYENAKIAAEDLNGTARYVGMGGAMEALGADISTISTNPAGIGLFRHSNVSVSFGLVSQADAKSAVGGSKTNASFDQAGFVYSARTGKTSFLNLAFNFHKSRNFNMILSASNGLNNASMNKLTYAKAKNGLLYEEYTNNNGEVRWDINRPYLSCNQLDDILAPNLNYDESRPQPWGYYDGASYQFDRAHKGYIGVYDFNISGNINNRVYLGLTVGIHDVHYKHYSEYSEDLTDFGLTVADDREITGSGFDVKAGIIVRPIESSPFRFGLSVSTPTFYELTTKNYTYVTDGRNTHSSRENNDAGPRTSYKFKLYTPWKFGASLAYTVGTDLALGATYELADYSSMDTRFVTSSYSNRSESDRTMNSHTKNALKSVHTIKVGAEYKIMPELAVRLGYNYVSSMYETDAFKDGTLDTDGSYVSSATDYTNWEGTHRITRGAGYTYKNFNVSLAYQFSTTKGTFAPFMSYVDDTTPADTNLATYTAVSNKRHQLLMTLGYTF